MAAMAGYQFLTNGQRSGATDVLLILGGLTALTAFYRSPWGKPIRYAWQKLYAEPRKQRRIEEAAEAAQSAVKAVVAPMFADAKAAAKSQHDEQNEVLKAQNEEIAAIRVEVTRGRTETGDLRADVSDLSTQLGVIEVRLNTGSDRFAVHEYRLEALEAPHPIELPDPTKDDS